VCFKFVSEKMVDEQLTKIFFLIASCTFAIASVLKLCMCFFKCHNNKHGCYKTFKIGLNKEDSSSSSTTSSSTSSPQRVDESAPAEPEIPLIENVENV
jgi:hypothetical protein